MALQPKKARFGKDNLHDDDKYVIGVPISSQHHAYSIISSTKAYLCDSGANDQCQIMPSPSKHCINIRRSRVNSVISKVIKLRESLDIFAQGIKEHVRIGAKMSETMNGKLRLGARILKVGGVKKVFKKNFKVIDGEKLLCASQCYVSTTPLCFHPKTRFLQ